MAARSETATAVQAPPAPARATPVVPAAAPAVPDLVLSRVFDAPPALVFRAWTDPALLARWLCCKDFTPLFAEADVRAGGAWRAGMRSPDGRDHISGGTYREVVPPARLAFTHAWEDAAGRLGHASLVTLTFADRPGGKTEMTFVQAGLASAESRASHTGGWNESFDRLVELLPKFA
ncbi:MAG: polyketide cyclase [Phycisphaerales bacterium]|nr:polyketide cyclase [Phycisphaerales bacterium]